MGFTSTSRASHGRRMLKPSHKKFKISLEYQSQNLLPGLRFVQHVTNSLPQRQVFANEQIKVWKDDYLLCR